MRIAAHKDRIDDLPPRNVEHSHIAAPERYEAQLPITGNSDRLWRDDHLYDFIIEIDHNTRPRVAGRGSAVFIHLARPDLTPSAGCVTMSKAWMRSLLRQIGRNTRVDIR